MCTLKYRYAYIYICMYVYSYTHVNDKKLYTNQNTNQKLHQHHWQFNPIDSTKTEWVWPNRCCWSYFQQLTSGDENIRFVAIKPNILVHRRQSFPMCAVLNYFWVVPILTELVSHFVLNPKNIYCLSSLPFGWLNSFSPIINTHFHLLTRGCLYCSSESLVSVL